MRVIITIIPHESQRYDTCGDWQFKGDELEINVSDSGNPKMNFLVALHEFIEAMLCNFNGVTDKQVDEYDFKHPESGCSDFDAFVDAPYHTQHNDALAIEWILSRLIGVNWKDYSEALEKMGWKMTGEWK